MSQQNDFTLRQVAQIALGGDSLGVLNISLLHSIINFTLKKLDCENEKVVLCGREAENLDKMLRESTFKPTLFLDDNDIKTPMKEFQNITQLEERVRILEINLEKHLTEVTSYTQDGSQPCEMKCEIEEQKDETISALLNNDFFARELKEYLSKPIICRMNRSDIKLKKISHDIEIFKKDCLKAHKKLDKLDDLTESFLIFHKKLDDYFLYFGTTMKEIQQNMDLKLNNRDMVEFKSDFWKMLEGATTKSESIYKMGMKTRALISFTEPLKHGKGAHKKLRSTKFKLEPKESKKSLCGCDKLTRHYEPPSPDLSAFEV